MKNKTLGFIGGGRITKIFLQAFKNQNVKFNRISVFDTNTDILEKLKESFPSIEIENTSIEQIAKSDIVLVALHPPLVMESLSKIKPFLNSGSMVVSLAPKITIEKMRNILDGFQDIARVNPSAPGIINEGINPVAFAEAMSEANKNLLLELLSILGKAPVVNESKIEAYAVISAMGSTYFWFQLQKINELAVTYGMSEEEAKEVISEMMKGTINTLFKSGIPANEVMDLVPVKPIGEYEEMIKAYYTEKLNGIYEKIKP